jgi:hypothetical protein
MIEPGDLHRYFKVRHIATGLTFWIMAGDTRYSITDPDSITWNYRIDPEGDCFLAESQVHTHPWGVPLRLDEVEPLPDGAGMYHPDHIASVMTLGLAMSYEGSWRQHADRERGAA